METQTLVALVGVGGVIIGSAVGGLISFLSARSMRRMEWQLSLAEKNILNRESLYAEFLTQANRLVLQSIEGNISLGTDLTAFIALEARIRFFSDSVGEAAQKIVVFVVNWHSKEHKEDGAKFPELRDKFISKCKEDLLALRKKA